MHRRELLKMIAATTGTALIGGKAVLAYSSEGTAGAEVLSADDVELLDAVAEAILPRTDTPGASDAKVAEFMQVFVRDCYTSAEQDRFLSGPVDIRERCQQQYGRPFQQLEDAERSELIETLDQEARTLLEGSGEGSPEVDAPGDVHYFTMIKQLTLFGFFTSEVGATEALRYVAVPGSYDGCAPYEQGEPAWAT